MIFLLCLSPAFQPSHPQGIPCHATHLARMAICVEQVSFGYKSSCLLGIGDGGLWEFLFLATDGVLPLWAGVGGRGGGVGLG